MERKITQRTNKGDQATDTPLPSHRDLLGAQRTMNYLITRSDVVADQIGDLKYLLEKVEQEIPIAQEIAQNKKAKILSRRIMFQVVANEVGSFLMLGGIVGGVGLAIKSSHDTDEWKKYSAEHFLTEKQSAPSRTGWMISYPSKDPAIGYQEKDSTNNFLVGDQEYLILKSPTNPQQPVELGIKIDHYRAFYPNIATGYDTIRLDIELPDNRGNEQWLLNSADPKLETSVVMFESTFNKQKEYIHFSRINSQYPLYQVKLMEQKRIVSQ